MKVVICMLLVTCLVVAHGVRGQSCFDSFNTMTCANGANSKCCDVLTKFVYSGPRFEMLKCACSTLKSFNIPIIYLGDCGFFDASDPSFFPFLFMRCVLYVS